MIKILIFLFGIICSSTTFAVQKPGVVTNYFYNSIDLSGNSIAVAESTTQNTDVINHDWGTTTPSAIASFNSNGNNFSIRYTGYIKIPNDGKYTFYLTGDDGVRLYLDCSAQGKTSLSTATEPSATPLIDGWVVQSAYEYKASCAQTFTAGEYYKYVLEYFEATGDAVVRLQWSARKASGSGNVFSQTDIPSGSNDFQNGGSYYDDQALAVNYTQVETSCAQPRQLYVTFDGTIDPNSVSPSDFSTSAGIKVLKTYVMPANKKVILLLESDLPADVPVSVKAGGILSSSGASIAPTSKSTTYASGQVLMPGILGSYFNQNNTNTVFTGTQTNKIDNTINFNWGTGAPADVVVGADKFSVSWNGYIKLPGNKQYQLRSTTDDGGRIYIDPSFSIGSTQGTIILNKWVDQSATSTNSSTLTGFDSSVYIPIRNEFYENGGDASASLSWLSTDGTLPATIIPAGNYFYCSTPQGIPAALNITESTESPLNGHIFTKLAGTPFTLTVSALKDSNGDGVGDQVEPNFAISGDRDVKIEIIDKSTGSSCSAYSSVQTQTLTFLKSEQSSNKGQKTVSLSVNNAYKNLGVRLTDVTNNIISCSTDSFSVRPGSFSITSTANNNGTSGTPIIKAGSSFTITADAGVSLYTGTPVINVTDLSAHTGAISVGDLAGSFNQAISGVSTGTYAYSEVGHFYIKAGGVIDNTWTVIDNSTSDCIAGSSNTLASGKYGCSIGNNTDTSLMGRFVPDHFEIDSISITPRNDIPTCTGTYNYIGEPIKWRFNLSAKNSSNVTTSNYTGVYNKLDLSNVNTYQLKAKSSAPLVTNLSNVSGVISNGLASVEIIGNLTRGSAVNQFSADWGLKITDTDNISVISNTDLDSVAGYDSLLLTSSLPHRFGMLKFTSITGNNRTQLRVPYHVLFRDSNGWRASTDDSCTTFSTNNVVIGNFSGVTAANITISGISQMLNGVGYINLKSSASGQGNFEIGVQNGSSLAMCPTFTQGNTSISSSKSYLYSNSCGSNFDKDPRARVSVGIASRNSPIIYWQEKY